MDETFEQFVERMGKVEKSDELVIGRWECGNTRSIFEFEKFPCYLECCGFRRAPKDRTIGQLTPGQMLWLAGGEPTERWVLADWVRGKKQAEDLAKRYDGEACPDEYHEDDKDAWYVQFKGDDAFEKMLKVIWDYRGGVLPKDTFHWKV